MTDDRPLTWFELDKIGRGIAIQQAQAAIGPATPESYASWISDILRCHVNRNMVICTASRNGISLQVDRPRPCGKTGSYWSDEEVARFKELYRRGESEEFTANDLGRTRASIRHKRKSLGLSANNLVPVKPETPKKKAKTRQSVKHLANYEITQTREKQARACQGELRAMIKHHKWFAAEIMGGRGKNGLPRWEKCDD